MPYLLKGDLITDAYEENIDEITREDNSIVEEKIEEAIEEAKSYLSRFDLVKLFGTEEVEPSVKSSLLKGCVKSIAIWKLIARNNPNIDAQMARTNYEDAINWLKKVQSGVCDPEGWPYKPTADSTPLTEGTAIGYSSNRKRRNYL